MRKFLSTLLIIVISATFLTACSTSVSESTTSDVEMKFASLKSPVELEVGETKQGNFKIDTTDEVSESDVEFISTNPDVAKFEYDKTALKSYVYYTITALSSGETTIYAKYGSSSTEQIAVVVKEQETTAPESENKKLFIEGKDYKLLDTHDVSIPGAVRKELRATITEEQLSRYSDETLEALVKRIIDEYLIGSKINGVSAYVYVEEDTDGEDVGEAVPVIYCHYYPYGEISRAADVKAGDYSTFEYKFTNDRAFRNQIVEMEDSQ